MTKIFLFRALPWLLVTVTVIFSFFGCAGVTSSGINRSLLARSSPKVVLPYHLVVKEKTHSFESDTVVNFVPMPDYVGFVFGLGGYVGAKLANRAIAGSDTQSRMRGTFLAGEAFVEAAKAYSHIGENARGIIELELLRIQPVFSYEAIGANRKLAANIEWSATFPAKPGAVTGSGYNCEYNPGYNDLFSSSKEKDVLREMTEYALGHWAQQLAAHMAKEDNDDDFPQWSQGQFYLMDGKCSYCIFVPPFTEEVSQQTSDKK